MPPLFASFMLPMSRAFEGDASSAGYRVVADIQATTPLAAMLACQRHDFRRAAVPPIRHFHCRHKSATPSCSAALQFRAAPPATLMSLRLSFSLLLILSFSPPSFFRLLLLFFAAPEPLRLLIFEAADLSSPDAHCCRHRRHAPFRRFTPPPPPFAGCPQARRRHFAAILFTRHLRVFISLISMRFLSPDRRHYCRFRRFAAVFATFRRRRRFSRRRQPAGASLIFSPPALYFAAAFAAIFSHIFFSICFRLSPFHAIFRAAIFADYYDFLRHFSADAAIFFISPLRR